MVSVLGVILYFYFFGLLCRPTTCWHRTTQVDFWACSFLKKDIDVYLNWFKNFNNSFACKTLLRCMILFISEFPFFISLFASKCYIIWCNKITALTDCIVGEKHNKWRKLKRTGLLKGCVQKYRFSEKNHSHH